MPNTPGFNLNLESTGHTRKARRAAFGQCTEPRGQAYLEWQNSNTDGGPRTTAAQTGNPALAPARRFVGLGLPGHCSRLPEGKPPE